MRVLIFGTFDKLHPGHLYVFQEAQKRGDLSVIIARDITVERLKGITPDFSQEQRQAAVQEEVPDAQVILGNPEDYLQSVLDVAPDLILFGYDQKLPLGITEEDLPCPTERLESFEPESYKSSIRRQKAQ